MERPKRSAGDDTREFALSRNSDSPLSRFGREAKQLSVAQTPMIPFLDAKESIFSFHRSCPISHQLALGTFQVRGNGCV